MASDLPGAVGNAGEANGRPGSATDAADALAEEAEAALLGSVRGAPDGTDGSSTPTSGAPAPAHEPKRSGSGSSARDDVSMAELSGGKDAKDNIKMGLRVPSRPALGGKTPALSQSEQLGNQMAAAKGNPLLAAAQRGDMEQVIRVLDSGVDPVKTRGGFQETCLHLCMLLHTPRHRGIARYLVGRFGKAIVDAEYHSDLFRGESAVHMAIVKRDDELLDLFIEADADVNKAATGSFFTRGNPECECPYGDYPLNFAVATGQEEVARSLLGAGASLYQRDRNGDNCLHVAVRFKRPDMYKFLLEWESEYVHDKDQDGFVINAAAAEISMSKRRLERLAETSSSGGGLRGSSKGFETEDPDPVGCCSTFMDTYCHWGSSEAVSDSEGEGGDGDADDDGGRGGDGDGNGDGGSQRRKVDSADAAVTAAARAMGTSLSTRLKEHETEGVQMVGGTKRRSLRRMRNAEGLTPLSLAAALGDEESFAAALGGEKDVLWQYDTVVGCSYPLDALEEAIQVVLKHGSTSLVVHPLILKMLHKKWRSFGRSSMIFSLVETAMYMLVFSFAATFSSDESGISGADVPTTFVADVALIACCVLCLLFSARFITRQRRVVLRRLKMVGKGAMDLAGEAGSGAVARRCCSRLQARCGRSSRSGSAVGTLKGGDQYMKYTRRLVWVHVLCVFVATPLRFIGEGETADIVLAVAAVTGWLYLLSFASGHPWTGHLVSMVVRMLVHDVTQFMLVFVLVLVGYSQAMILLFRGATDNPAQFAHTPSALATLSLMSMGDWDFDLFDKARSPVAAKVCFFTFVLLSTVLLLNMLIALMADTYAAVTESAEKTFRFVWATLIYEYQAQLSPSRMKQLAIVASHTKTRTKGDVDGSADEVDGAVWHVTERISEEELLHELEREASERHAAQRVTNALGALVGKNNRGVVGGGRAGGGAASSTLTDGLRAAASRK